MLRGKSKPKPDPVVPAADQVKIDQKSPTSASASAKGSVGDLSSPSLFSSLSASAVPSSVSSATSSSTPKSFNAAASHFLDRLHALSSDANLQQHLAAVLPRQLFHHLPRLGSPSPFPSAESTPYEHLSSSPPLPPSTTGGDDTTSLTPVLPPLYLPPPLPERGPSGPPPPPPPPLPPRNCCSSPLSVSTSSSTCSHHQGTDRELDVTTMYRPSPSASSPSTSTSAAGPGGFVQPHQPAAAFMPAAMSQAYGHQHQQHSAGHAPGSIPMPQPMPMPMPMSGSAAVGVSGGMVQAENAGKYPPPSPSPSAASSAHYPLQHPSAHQYAQQQPQQPGVPHSVTSSLGSLGNQGPSPTASAASFNAPPRYFATNSSTKSTASTSAPAAPHAPPMTAAATAGAGGNYPGRNSQYFHDPSVPIPAIPDTLKKQPPVTPSSSSIHSGVSSAHMLITDPSNLPRQILDIDRRVMLFVSASGTNPMSLGAFPHDIEDVMFASSPTPYDMEILPEYDTSSLDAAAKRLLLYIKLMSFDTKRTMRVMLVGVDVGGIVALEAVRLFLGAVAAQTPQFGTRGPVDPRDREANWLLRVVFDGVLCVNAPVFLLHPQVFGNVDRSAFGKYAELFAFPPQAVTAHGTGSSGGSEAGSAGGGRKKDRGGVFGFGKLAKVVGGMAGSSPSSPASGGSSPSPSPAPVQIPFDASWAARLGLMAPLLQSHDDRINRVTQLLHAKVPLAFLVTQTSNPQAVTSPTFVHVPDNLPKYISRLVVPFTAPPTSPVSSYQLIGEALDKGRQPGMYAQIIQYVTRVAGHWASVAR